MRYFRRFLEIVGALTLAALLVGGALVATAGHWLRVDDQPRKADAIVVLAGELRRAVHAADLYNQGLAPVIYLGRPRHDPPQALCDLGFECARQEQVMLRILAAKGVPVEAVRLYGQELMSTVDEGENLRRELGPEKKTLLVVTSAYHCRRARMILSNTIGGHELLMSPTPYERFEKDWWNHQLSSLAVVSEVSKFVFYFLGTPFRARPAAAL